MTLSSWLCSCYPASFLLRVGRCGLTNLCYDLSTMAPKKQKSREQTTAIRRVCCSRSCQNQCLQDG